MRVIWFQVRDLGVVLLEVIHESRGIIGTLGRKFFGNLWEEGCGVLIRYISNNVEGPQLWEGSQWERTMSNCSEGWLITNPQAQEPSF